LRYTGSISNLFLGDRTSLLHQYSPIDSD
jgi:hypothetical protein